MTRVKLNLASGSVQEREVVTAFNSNGTKYIIFDGESTGSMGLPIILVSKENLGKVVGITDAEEWKNTKECLKKIISGEKVEYSAVSGELSSDDIYYRQLTLPIASFDILKSSYEAPATSDSEIPSSDNTPVFEPITPEDIAGSSVQNVEPVAPSVFNAPSENNVTNQEIVTPAFTTDTSDNIAASVSTNEATSTDVESPVTPTGSVDSNYEELKKEFLTAAEELFNNIYSKLNH